MEIVLQKAKIEDAELIHKLQIESFANLLEKYKDYATSPGAETIERIVQRLKQEFTDYYLIKYKYENVGAIRILKLNQEEKCRISPIFIIPKYQNKGIAQQVFKIIEENYKPKNGWVLDTILEEIGNCYLYEKLGYRKTGEVEEISDKMHIVFYEKKNN